MKLQYIFYAVALVLIVTPLQAAVGGSNQTSVKEQVGSSFSGTQLSAEEQEWFEVFQEGTFFARGWREITDDILAETPPELQEKQRIALAKLGRKIGYEWSKDNTVRKIDTNMLQKWGKLLQNTAGENPQQLKEVIAEIDQKVGLLLN